MRGQRRGGAHPCHLLAALAAWAALAACSGGTPTQPTPPPPPPTAACPADVDTELTSGTTVAVTYDLPSVQGGTPPLNLACNPASGSAFPAGETPVTCTVVDASGRSASCQFRVRVATPIRLQHTRFLAFGDSITEGKTSTAWMTLMFIAPGHSYTAQLEQILSEGYPDQDIIVINEGLGGESTAQGRQRLPGVIAAHPDAEVLLLLEGVNGVRSTPTSAQIANLRAMVRHAKGQGLEVLIATLMPVSAARDAARPRTQQMIRDLNAAIKTMAAQEGIDPVVDLYAAFGSDESLLSPDGLHPNEEGYRVIAETFAEEITRRFETGGPVVSTMRARRLRRW